MNKKEFLDWLSIKTSPLLMGILNITPDSFFDGGSYYSTKSAVTHARSMIEAGVDIIDVGGSSSRPGSKPVSVHDELSRIIPVIQALTSEFDICISVDTSEPLVMQAAVEVGGFIINDIWALQKPGALEMASELNVPVCLMHMQGRPENMQMSPDYPKGIITEICNFISARIHACEAHGIKREQLIIDPGIGFGKTTAHNLTILKELQHFQSFGSPILVGASRKSFLGNILQKDIHNRLIGSVVASTVALLNGANIIRVHDVLEMRDAISIIESLRGCI